MDYDFPICEKPNLRPTGTRRRVDIRSGKTIRFVRNHSRALRRYKNGYLVKYTSDDTPNHSIENTSYYRCMESTEKEELISRDPTRDSQPTGIYLSVGKKKRWEYVEMIAENRENLANMGVAVVEVPVVNSGSHLNTHRDRACLRSHLTQTQAWRRMRKRSPRKESLHPRLVKGRKGLMIRRPRFSFKRRQSESDKLYNNFQAFSSVFVVEKPLERGVFPAFVCLKDARHMREPRKERRAFRAANL